MRKSAIAVLVSSCALLSASESSRKVLAQTATPLAKLAASMEPGTWVKLPTNGPSREMIFPAGAMGILAYSMNIAWDSTNHVGYFYGGEHTTGHPECDSGARFDQPKCADASQRFLKYEEATNSWSLQMDSVTGKPHSGLAASPGTHGNGELTLDSSTGDLYKHHFFGTTNLQKFSRSTQSWSALANPSTEGFIPGFAWFPEANGIVRVHGGHQLIDFWSKASNKWTTLFTSVRMGAYPGVAIYNMVLHDMLVNGGCGYPPNPGDDRNFYILSYKSGRWSLSQPRQTPVFLVSGVRQLCLDSDGEAGHVSVDPITGKYLVITRDASGKNAMFEYDSQADKWTQMTGSRVPPPILQMGDVTRGSGGLIPSVAIPEYGVVMFLNGTATGAEVWLYKHAQSSSKTRVNDAKANVAPAAAPTTAPDRLYTFVEKCGMPGVLKCAGFDNQPEIRYHWPSPKYSGKEEFAGSICDDAFAVAFPGALNYHFDPQANPSANVRATVQNGRCVYATIDTSIKHSGAGSIKFPIPNHSNQDTSGEFAEPFKKYADGTFGYVGPQTMVPVASAHHEGDELWIQWYERIDAGMLQRFDGYLFNYGFSFSTTEAGATTIKSIGCNIPSAAVGRKVWFTSGSGFTLNQAFNISSVSKDGCRVVVTSSPTPTTAGGSPVLGVGYVDGAGVYQADGWKQFGVYGNPPNTSCCGPSSQISVNTDQLGVARAYSYDQNGTVLYGVQDVRKCPWVDYNPKKYSEPPCIRYHPDQWQEYTVHIKIRGTSGQHTSVFQKWIDGQLVQDLDNFALTWGSPETANGLGQFTMSPYNTRKDPNQNHSDSAVWYDDVIISTQRIPMVNGRPSVKD